MKQTLKYSLIVLSLFFLGQNAANAQEVLDQYKEGGGVATSKKVSSQNADGSYTITLETFATGTSAVVQKNVPADIVLVLDLTTSMRVSRGTTTRVTARTDLSYDMVVNARTKDSNYLYSSGGNTRYQLFGETYTQGGQTRYVLYYNQSGNNNRYYLTSNGTTQTRGQAAYATSSSGTIVTFNGGNNSRLFTGSSRIFDLKEATCAFIDAIEKNDTEKAPQGQDRLGNKFSIITYAGAPPVVEQQLDDIGTMDLEALKAKVWAFDLHNGTYPAEAITYANTQLSTRGHSTGTVGDDFTRTVVLFTDGDPYDTPKYQAINPAHESKSTLKASVFTVGMFDTTPSGSYDNPGGSSDLWKFMNFMSSNYPDATVSNANVMTGGEGSNKGYYKDVSGDDVNLSDVFTAIAGAAGGSSATIGTQTQVRDVISSSFAIAFPENVTTAAQKQQWVEDNVKVYTSTIAEDGKSWGTLSPFDATVTYVVEKDQDNVEYDAIRVEGFDYSKPDTKDEHGYTTPANAGNWVGLRYRGQNQPFYAGKKVVITVNIFIQDGVTGGITGTNTQQSGVYVYNEKTQSYDPVNYYEVPSKVLSVTIKITKEGLRSGESATFLVKKASPLRDENGDIVYNAIGKPEPDPTTWDVDHKVILTNKSTTDGALVEKTMIGLDPGFVYEVQEDDWGWAYEINGTGGTMTTSSVTINPFYFENTEKTEIGGAPIRKHAEAVSINHFGYTIPSGPFQGKQTENYKSSKVESF